MSPCDQERNNDGADLAVEVVLEELLDLRNSGGATDKDDLSDLVLLELGVFEDLLDGAESLLEEVHVELLKAGASEGLREVLATMEGLDLNAGLGLGGEDLLGALNFTTELLERLLVTVGIKAGLLLEGLEEVLHGALIKVLTTKMGITGSGNDLKDAVINCLEGVRRGGGRRERG